MLQPFVASARPVVTLALVAAMVLAGLPAHAGGSCSCSDADDATMALADDAVASGCCSSGCCGVDGADEHQGTEGDTGQRPCSDCPGGCDCACCGMVAKVLGLTPRVTTMARSATPLLRQAIGTARLDSQAVEALLQPPQH